MPTSQKLISKLRDLQKGNKIHGIFLNTHTPKNKKSSSHSHLNSRKKRGKESKKESKKRIGKEKRISSISPAAAPQ